MRLDEAIKHAQEIADNGCDQCAKDHHQLADWLIELKQRREKSRVDMEQKDKELLIKDLSGRIPYRHNFWLQVREFDEDAPSNRRMLTKYIDDIYTGWVVKCKPYLRPMSSMTDEEEDEYEIIIRSSLTTHIDWLNKNMFDYRGLIPKGLALEAPEGMYNS